MTLADQMASDVTNVFLITDEHAVEVTRVPASGSSVTGIPAIWEPEDSKMRSAQNEVTHDTGKSLVWRGRLYLSSSLTVAETDQWTIDGETWQCVEIGKPSGGMLAIDLQRKQRTQTNKSSGMLL